MIDGVIDGEHLPAAPDAPDLNLAADYAPHIFVADDEPFLPLVAGYTIFHDEADSPSFRRRIERAGLPAWTTCIEYAIWWDWDIGHLYELEHIWSYVGADGGLVWAEGSMHGWQNALTLDDETIPHHGTHPVAYAQPGKHAFAPSLDWFQEIWDTVLEDAGPKAGEGRVLVKDMYEDVITKTRDDDARVSAYLRRLAFTPALRFTRCCEISRDMLVPWPVLDAWIPARVNWWIAQLRSMPDLLIG
jgi:hypothetical protein